jgi:hypothetical protein
LCCNQIKAEKRSIVWVLRPHSHHRWLTVIMRALADRPTVTNTAPATAPLQHTRCPIAML